MRHNISASHLMALMEEGEGRSDLEKAQIVLAWGYPEKSWEEITLLPIGGRDSLLLDLHQNIFGPKIKLSCLCPKCGAVYEFETNVPELLSASPDTVVHPITLNIGSFEILLRPLNGRDIASIPVEMLDHQVVHFLAHRSVLEIHNNAGEKQPVPAMAEIKPEWIKKIAVVLEAADPLSIIAFKLECMDCGHDWHAIFDASQLVWRGLKRENAMALDEIHLLAKHYGWRESDIVNIPPTRRHAYVQKLREEEDA